MTNVVIRKDQDPVQGMQDAGDYINDWRKFEPGTANENDAKGFFHDLFGEFDSSADHSVDIFEDGQYLPLAAKLNETGDPIRNKFEYVDTANVTISLTTVPTEDDKKGRNPNNKNQRMSIGIPAKQDLLGGYVGTIVNDLASLLAVVDANGNVVNGGAAVPTDEAKKYLLAVIFLNRCQ